MVDAVDVEAGLEPVIYKQSDPRSSLVNEERQIKYETEVEKERERELRQP